MVDVKLVKHRFVSPQATVDLVRKRYSPVPDAVCFDINHRGAPNTRVWAQEFRWGSNDGLLDAVRYARGDRGPPRYFTVEANSYINIYF